ncbi:hypothetical protein GWK50_02000 [Acidovorax sp. 210-6]|uniref:hypothetical protein n=1 Tax=Acidovorax sp. 210-6 TaxID=2699468 RepID=UPI00138A628E|nr:hypothetical protein [Acidovorax sp. 210-6]NCU64629.1 hypothetical protein [Acidovorax sp. 210-6]
MPATAHRSLTQDERDLLAAYHAAPAYAQHYAQVTAFVGAGKKPTPLMCQLLEQLAALVVMHGCRA